MSSTLKLLASKVAPGVSAFELDQLAESEIRKAGGTPAFKNYQPAPGDSPYPASLCVSVNDEVVHGIPTKQKILKNGDIVGLDLGVIFGNLYTDAAITVPVGQADPESLKLIEAASESLQNAINILAPGKTTGDIGHAIETTVKKYKFQVVRDLVGHGVGKSVHEAPEIPCYGKPGTGTKFEEGMVVAIEPMINAGSSQIQFMDDEWTIKTGDGSRSSHMEHTLLITRNGCEILTNVV